MIATYAWVAELVPQLTAYIAKPCMTALASHQVTLVPNAC
jgi:hypothetical protein